MNAVPCGESSRTPHRREQPAFAGPTKFIGPVYGKDEANRLAAEKDWAFKQDGDKWSRVVASPQSKRVFGMRPIRWLHVRNTVVIAAGGGIPAVYEKGVDRKLVGIECVIDKDLASGLPARAERGPLRHAHRRGGRLHQSPGRAGGSGP